MHGKFESLWLGPFKIHGKVGTNCFNQRHLNGEKLSLPMNGQILKLYYPNGD
jgi:hypothetical protein